MTALRLHNPATGESLESVITDTHESVHEKGLIARAAQAEWAAQPYEERASALCSFAEKVSDNIPQLARILTEDMGKPLRESESELRGFINRIKYFLDAVPDETLPRIEKDDAQLREEVRSEPLGVIGVISAWNYPWFVGGNVLIPALLTGSAVLYKPSEHAARTGRKFVELLRASGVHEGAIQLLIGEGIVGQWLCQLPLDGLCFTGSVATGKRIARTLAEYNPFCRAQYELGGKDSVYVCDDADVQKAAASLVSGAFYNTGQSCCSVEHIYVEKTIAAEFEDMFVSLTRSLRKGSPFEPETEIVPMARPEHNDFLAELVEDARAKGAEILCGGELLHMDGLNPIFSPTVIRGIHDGMRIAHEEIFGPIVTIQVVEDDEEAAQEMSKSAFGLTTGVYSSSQERAEAVLTRLRSGSSYWNTCDRVSPCLPWTARGQSGSGYTLGVEGIRSLLFRRSWHLIQP